MVEQAWQRDRVADLVDPVFDEVFASGTAPGLVYGVVADGKLLHCRGLGVASVADADAGAPDSRTAFRIASMTKSFTAATLLSLRDEGRIDLDAHAVEFVPQLAGVGEAGGAITVRQLLTMTAGFASDDPWGDRQQGLLPDVFAALVASELAPHRRPGDRFEYSNLGYALIGRVIEAVTDASFKDVVTERILQPLEMGATGFDPALLDEDNLATGYVRRGERWQVEPLAPYGAFAPMGGLFSCIEDLAHWVSLMIWANREAHDVESLSRTPLAASSLREMQRGHRLVDAVAEGGLTPSGPGSLTVRSYGYGLFEELSALGRVVMHSGGYPGFGSHMRWHVSSGLGIVALGNRTYAPMGLPAARGLQAALAAADRAARVPPAHQRLAAARAILESLLTDWDEAKISSWFADNVALDEPWEMRRQHFERLASEHGPLTADPTAPPQDTSPGHTLWWLTDESGGRVKLELSLSPHRNALIQWFEVTAAPVLTVELEGATAEVKRLSMRIEGM